MSELAAKKEKLWNFTAVWKTEESYAGSRIPENNPEKVLKGRGRWHPQTECPISGPQLSPKKYFYHPSPGLPGHLCHWVVIIKASACSIRVGGHARALLFSLTAGRQWHLYYTLSIIILWPWVHLDCSSQTLTKWMALLRLVVCLQASLYMLNSDKHIIITTTTTAFTTVTVVVHIHKAQKHFSYMMLLLLWET